jgi:hypothetical protein
VATSGCRRALTQVPEQLARRARPPADADLGSLLTGRHRRPRAQAFTLPSPGTRKGELHGQHALAFRCSRSRDTYLGSADATPHERDPALAVGVAVPVAAFGDAGFEQDRDLRERAPIAPNGLPLRRRTSRDAR